MNMCMYLTMAKLITGCASDNFESLKHVPYRFHIQYSRLSGTLLQETSFGYKNLLKNINKFQKILININI